MLFVVHEPPEVLCAIAVWFAEHFYGSEQAAAIRGGVCEHDARSGALAEALPCDQIDIDTRAKTNESGQLIHLHLHPHPSPILLPLVIAANANAVLHSTVRAEGLVLIEGVPGVVVA